MTDYLYEILEPLAELNDDECIIETADYIEGEFEDACAVAIAKTLKRFVEHKRSMKND